MLRDKLRSTDRPCIGLTYCRTHEGESREADPACQHLQFAVMSSSHRLHYAT